MHDYIQLFTTAQVCKDAYDSKVTTVSQMLKELNIYANATTFSAGTSFLKRGLEFYNLSLSSTRTHSRF